MTPEDNSASQGYDSTSRDQQINDYSSYTAPGNPGELYPCKSYTHIGVTGSTASGSYGDVAKRSSYQEMMSDQVNMVMVGMLIWTK